jgi:hypothetical protein
MGFAVATSTSLTDERKALHPAPNANAKTGTAKTLRVFEVLNMG